jgi:DNA-nicking Smr family endonuclease
MTAPDDGPSRRKGRRLNEQERTLWKAVATSITPLRRRTVKASEPDEPQIVRAPKAAEPAPPARTRSSLMKTAAPVLKPPAPPSLEPLERRDRKRIARGRIAIDARIDLHGRTQAEAYDALLAFIRRSQTRGARTVLVITGKGSTEGGAGRGVLKRQVPMWLASPELRTCILGVETASLAHGGEGALYVRLRRDRSAPIA